MSMSPTRDPDTAPVRTARFGEKQRAAIVLAVIAVAAVVLVVIMVSLLGSSGNSPGSAPLAIPTGPAVTVTGGAQPSTHTSRPPSSQARSSSSAVPPSNRAVSCPTSAPCALPDDIGDFIGVLNTYRSQHGKQPVAGKVTQAAQTCAVSSGNNCPSNFYWEPVGRSGQQMLSKITDSGSGSADMLNSNLKTVQVGWAYIPSSQSFECALILGG
jgi:hypothetical protein